jgi:hypothetical protein
MTWLTSVLIYIGALSTGLTLGIAYAIHMLSPTRRRKRDES